MYTAIADPYCYAGTSVLKNIPGIRDQAALEAFEAIATAQRADEPLPPGRLSVTQYRAIHRHLFQDVFAWSGKFRTVRINKDGSAFCYPENIAREMNALLEASSDGAISGIYRATSSPPRPPISSRRSTPSTRFGKGTAARRRFFSLFWPIRPDIRSILIS